MNLCHPHSTSSIFRSHDNPAHVKEAPVLLYGLFCLESRKYGGEQVTWHPEQWGNGCAEELEAVGNLNAGSAKQAVQRKLPGIIKQIGSTPL
jgi:hypothetical protein